MNDINTLFERKQAVDAKDPGDLEPSDIDTLVEFYRYRRSRKSEFNAKGEMTLDSVVPVPAPKLTPGFDRRGL